jgi:hypothetical protein
MEGGLTGSVEAKVRRVNESEFEFCPAQSHDCCARVTSSCSSVVGGKARDLCPVSRAEN